MNTPDLGGKSPESGVFVLYAEGLDMYGRAYPLISLRTTVRKTYCFADA
ncbi:hypothetical protein SAMN04487896_5604 [Paenibacillus sp. ov031]|nr:hypothetical protein SAMN04487896_5604 [Paenibacillus sp. ov031]